MSSRIVLLCSMLMLSTFPNNLNAELDSYIKPHKHWDLYISQRNKLTENESPKKKSHKTFFQQWFTGPLITPSPITIDPKTPAIGLGLAQYYYYGNYDIEPPSPEGEGFLHHGSANAAAPQALRPTSRRPLD